MDDFKYITIVEWVKDYIKKEQLAPGTRFYSEKELCDIHNVSRQTVRQALMVLENQDILRRKRGSGTFVKNTGVKSYSTVARNCNVGVVSTYFSDYIFPSIVTGIEKVLKNNNVGMQLSITHNQVFEESKALKTMLEQDIRALIIEPSRSALPNPNIKLYERIKELNIPLVFFNAKYPWADFPCVAMDDVAAGKIATEHLIQLGHSKIGGIFAFDDIQGHKRYQGFLSAFEKHGISLEERDVMWFSTGEKKDFFEREDRMKDFLERVTAVVCYNDSHAVSLLELCKKWNVRVPEDLSVVGIDDSKLAKICEVPLTTVRHPHQQLGERAAQKVLEMITNPEKSFQDVLYEPVLVERQSTRKLG